MPATFHTARNTLEDGSETFDVMCSDFDQMIVCEPASETTAEAISDALNGILTRFLDCGSDREVLSLAVSLDSWLSKHAK